MLFSGGDTVAYPDKEKKRLSENLEKLYVEIDGKFKDRNEQVAILQNGKTPFVTELFKNQLESETKEVKTRLLIELLKTHFDSLDKRDTTPFVNKLFKDQLDSAKQEDKTALIVELLKTHYEFLDKEDTTPLITKFFKQECNSIEDAQKQEILNELLKNYSREEQQKFVNDLHKIHTNAQLLTNISDLACEQVGEKANPFYVGAMPVIDWLNTAHFNGFFRPTMKNTLVNRNVSNEFDSFDQWGLWIEPFGFYTKFRREDEALKFDLYTVGCSVGGEYTFFERLVLGLGFAYTHSGVEWEQKSDNATINSLYFGPSLSYVFSKGFLSCTIFGIANYYHVNREIAIFDEVKPTRTAIDYLSWDIVARLEGGLSYPFGNQFYINPTARIDYLNVLEQESSEPLDDDTEIKTGPLNGSFMSSKVGLKFTREFFSSTIGFLIPSLSGGCFFFTPLANGSYKYQVEGCKLFTKKQKVGGWTQYYLGAGFALVHKKGVLISLDYEMMLGADSPVYAGDIRVEWSW